MLESEFSEANYVSDRTREEESESKKSAEHERASNGEVEETVEAEAEEEVEEEEEGKVEEDEDFSRDSDDDLDDVLDEVSFKDITHSLDHSYYRIPVRGTSFSTYRAVLVWIHTGYIEFSPLLSTFHHLPESERVTARVAAANALIDSDPRLPLPASPKSVYKLAHYLSLPTLERLALEELSRQLTIENVFLELFDGLPTVYNKVRKLEVEFVVKHKKLVVGTKGFKEVVEKLRKNELGGSGQVLADLLPLLLGGQ